MASVYAVINQVILGCVSQKPLRCCLLWGLGLYLNAYAQPPWHYLPLYKGSHITFVLQLWRGSSLTHVAHHSGSQGKKLPRFEVAVTTFALGAQPS